jgi:DNA-binding beta-propeller fold protein YncE
LIKKCINVEVAAQQLGRIAFISDKILITDFPNKLIKITSPATETFGSFRSEHFEKPWCVCVNKRNEILVSDLNGNKITIFNSDLKFIRDFKTEMSASYLTTDKHSDYVFVSHYLKNKVSVYDGITGENIGVDINIDSPIYIEIGTKTIYVVSHTEFEQTPDTNKLIRIKKGSNCIYVIEKRRPFDVLHVISSDVWLAPLGLYLDKNGNLLTTAYKISPDKTISKIRYLFVLDKDGNVLASEQLSGVTQCNSIAINERRLVISYDKSIKLYELE